MYDDSIDCVGAWLDEVGAFESFSGMSSFEKDEVFGALETFDPDEEEVLGGFSLKRTFRKAKRAVKNPKRTITRAGKSAVRNVKHPKRVLRRAGRSGRKAIHIGGKIGTNKYVVAGAAGVALAFPPAAPAAGAFITAGKALKVADGMLGTPSQQKAVRKAIKNTALRAKRGDKNAKRMTKVMATVIKRRAKSAGKASISGILVLPGGKIKRGRWKGL